MSHGDRKSSLWPLLVTVPVLAIAVFAAAFWFQAEPVSAESATGTNLAVAPTATFAANSATLGGIPDSNLGTPACQNNSTTMRDVTFNASGLTGSITSVSVNFNASHTWVQDVEVTLIAPSAQQHLLFSATGTTSTAANACQGSNDLISANTYTFADSASANWWTTAGAATIPTSTNRTVVTGIGGVPSGVPATTSLNTAFAGATANGTWTLRFRDRGAGDTGTVTAANLTITTGAGASDAPMDMDGDGRSDYVVVRNTGGGSGGQVSWFVKSAATNATTGAQWGISTDFFVSQDFDNDNKDDIAVWRPGSSGVAAFYIFQSATNTARVEPFGQTGDDPTIVGDYNGDGSADLAVYRGGANPGDQSTWFYRTTVGGPVFYVPWGINGDFPAPGDYDGNGSNDFVVQRNNGGGQARFWIRYSTGTVDSSIVWGTPSDLIVPGDYDGDGKTDIAVTRGSGGNIQWWIRSSLAPPANPTPITFGLSATDFPTQGDYDGDGKVEPAVWRPTADPTMCFFYTLSGTGALATSEWGQQGDYPVANYNSH